jgi:hypothetical protein
VRIPDPGLDLQRGFAAVAGRDGSTAAVRAIRLTRSAVGLKTNPLQAMARHPPWSAATWR